MEQYANTARSGSWTIGLDGLPQGLYLLEVHTTDGVQTTRLVKQ